MPGPRLANNLKTKGNTSCIKIKIDQKRLKRPSSFIDELRKQVKGLRTRPSTLIKYIKIMEEFS